MILTPVSFVSAVFGRVVYLPLQDIDIDSISISISITTLHTTTTGTKEQRKRGFRYRPEPPIITAVKPSPVETRLRPSRPPASAVRGYRREIYLLYPAAAEDIDGRYIPENRHGVDMTGEFRDCPACGEEDSDAIAVLIPDGYRLPDEEVSAKERETAARMHRCSGCGNLYDARVRRAR